MKLVHHYTGEWIRSDCNTSVMRTDGYVNEYPSTDVISDEWIRGNFEGMLSTGESVISTGSHVFQIRGE